MTNQFKQKGKQHQTVCVQTACACSMTKQGIEYNKTENRELLQGYLFAYLIT